MRVGIVALALYQGRPGATRPTNLELPEQGRPSRFGLRRSSPRNRKSRTTSDDDLDAAFDVGSSTGRHTPDDRHRNGRGRPAGRHDDAVVGASLRRPAVVHRHRTASVPRMSGNSTTARSQPSGQRWSIIPLALAFGIACCQRSGAPRAAPGIHVVHHPAVRAVHHFGRHPDRAATSTARRRSMPGCCWSARCLPRSSARPAPR